MMSNIANDYFYPKDSTIVEESIAQLNSFRMRESVDNLSALQRICARSTLQSKVKDLIDAIRQISENEELDEKYKLLASL